MAMRRGRPLLRASMVGGIASHAGKAPAAAPAAAPAGGVSEAATGGDGKIRSAPGHGAGVSGAVPAR